MQVRDETPGVLAAEVQIVPAWAWVLAGVAFVAAQFFFNIFLARQLKAPPAWARPLLGLLAGLFGGCYFLLLGYVNRDAKRRGMSPILWTCVAVLIPNALGFLLYFVLRQPLRRACPQCGSAVQTEFNFCPRCNYKLSPSCPQCQRIVGVGDVYCPFCGTSLRTHPAAPVSNPAARLPG
ncbi:MAG TPA: zinc ribbon domain-containing protein [Terriglobales bacterium]|nr:zinc ribbon domain-containing protein [Terriglobales bacterium]